VLQVDLCLRTGARALGLALLALALAGPVSAQTSEAEQVLELFERALNAHDEEAVVRLFAPDGVVRDTKTHVDVIGRAELPGWVRAARERNLHAHLGDYTSSDGKTHFTIELGQGEWFRTGQTPLRARGTAEVQAGRIVVLVLEPAAQAPSADRGVTRESATWLPYAPLAAALVSLLALAAALKRLRLRRPAERDVRLTAGALHAALGSWSKTRRRFD
jgi:hypothetical protein